MTSEEELENETLKLVERIICHPETVISIGKEAFYKQIKMNNLEDAYNYAEDVMVENLQEYDAKEGILSFIEKRKPNWKS